MKIFIATEGGRDIGFGHVTRCLSLCQAFEERGIKPEFIINGDEAIKQLLGGRTCHVFNWLKDEERLYGLIADSSATIVDSYLADARFYEMVQKTVKIPVYIDDNKRIDYPRGFVVNGMVYAEEIDYPQKNGITYLLGSGYVPLRRQFWGIDEKTVRGSIEDIMITFGGDDSREMTPKVLKLLQKEFSSITKHVVIGNSFKNRDAIERLKDSNTYLIYNPDVEDMIALMRKSDIAVSAGGQTLYELARVGVPTVGICVADNQVRNLEGWRKKGFLEYIGWYCDKALSANIKKAIEHLMPFGVRKDKSTAGFKSVDGKGSIRVVQEILAALFRDRITFRTATYGDAQPLLELYNDEIVRNNSFNPERVGWEHHTKWLAEKLNSKNCLFFVIDIDGHFCGQVRFDISSDRKEAIINISLSKTLRGLGLGDTIVSKSIDELLKVRSNIKSVKAFIKKENIASLKTFEKASFRFIEDTIYKDNETKVYTKDIDYVRAK